jgi:D-serine deaminase-like pyridoxal phosphate-dependent protein
MSQLINNIDTPAILIERRTLEKNMADMQSLAQRNNVNLRVHIKTHKIPELARLQLQHGAVGIAVAKLGEAEIMAAAGIKDIQIANIMVGKDKIRRLVRLNRICRLSVAVDSVENVREISAAFERERNPIGILIKVNSGLNRCGSDSLEEITQLLKAVERLKSLNVLGLMNHAGHAYGATNRKEVQAIGRSEGKLLVDYARKLRAAGYEMKVLSVGSTPTAPYCSRVKGITELRVGNYLFNDMTQVALGTVPIGRCALSILATVISVHEGNRVVIDTGSKALALDKGAHGREILKGYGHIISTGDHITRLSEEHGIIDIPAGKYKLGQKVRIIPNHACTVMNLFDDAYLVDGDKVIRKLKIAARGKMN